MEKGIFNTVQMRILVSLAILMFMIALASYASLNFEKIKHVDPMPATISVSGEGEVLAVPDIGQFSFSVTAEGENAVVAQEDSGTKVNAILAYLREQGIEDKDIKVQNYNLYPLWKYEEKICPVGSYCPRERVQDGFEVTQTVRVKVRETDKAAGIIAGVGERGATNISNLSFTVDDTDVIQAEAREKAIIDAKEKAVVLAEQLGVRLVRIVSFDENGGGYNEPVMRMAAMDSEEATGFGGAELPMGEESTTVTVNVTFEIK